MSTKAETVVHYVIMLDRVSPHIAQLEGVDPNERRGSVVPVKATAGKQRFACDMADMSKVAGKMWEGAHHHGCGDPQFVNCPFCKETTAYQEDMAEHERYAAQDKGLFSGIFAKTRASAKGGTTGTVASPVVAQPDPAPDHSGPVLPDVASTQPATVADE